MIPWKLYGGEKTLKSILDKVGTAPRGGNSNKFLVMAGFEGCETQPHFAVIISHREPEYSIIVETISGNVVITHWTEIERPAVITGVSCIITEQEIKKAADEDFRKQSSYDASYDRRKGFIAGVKWLLNLQK